MGPFLILDTQDFHIHLEMGAQFTTWFKWHVFICFLEPKDFQDCFQVIFDSTKGNIGMSWSFHRRGHGLVYESHWAYARPSVRIIRFTVLFFFHFFSLLFFSHSFTFFSPAFFHLPIKKIRRKLRDEIEEGIWKWRKNN